MKNYLQRAWSDAMDDIGMHEIKNVLVELQSIDDEHGAFWVSIVNEEETILEVDKEMKMTAVFNGDGETPLVKILNELEDALPLFELLLQENFKTLRQKMNS